MIPSPDKLDKSLIEKSWPFCSRAHSGYWVLTPDIADFRRLRMNREAVDQIRLWFHYLQNFLPGGKKTALAGISVAGTLVLIAAAQPEIQSDLAFVLSVGGYGDLFRCNRFWFAPASQTRSDSDRHGGYPDHFYGRWIAMLQALPALRSSMDRRVLEPILYHLLLTGKAPVGPRFLTAEGERWYRLAASKDVDDSQLRHLIEAELAARFLTLNPGSVLENIRRPVFLVHGAYDDLIPPDEIFELQKRIPRPPVRLLITPLITHTHPRFHLLADRQKWKSYWRGFWFLNALIRQK